ncbi:hypothetical protein VTO73DRAFT_13937 [Trametes versicolor]
MPKAAVTYARQSSQTLAYRTLTGSEGVALEVYRGGYA